MEEEMNKLDSQIKQIQNLEGIDIITEKSNEQQNDDPAKNESFKVSMRKFRNKNSL